LKKREKIKLILFQVCLNHNLIVIIKLKMAGKINRQSDKDDKEIEEVYRMDAEENHREEIAENILFQKEQKEKENMRKRNKRASFTNDEIEVNKYKNRERMREKRMISSPEEKETYKESDKIKRARARLSLSPEEIVIAKESNTFNRARARLILSPEERVIDKESDTFNRAIARGFLSEERKEFIADLEKKTSTCL